MTDKKFDPMELEHYFAAAGEYPARPSDAVMARVLADALDVQAAARPEVTKSRPRVSGVKQILGELGGWPAMAGLTSAALTGVWLGINPPDELAATADAFLGSGDAAYLIDVVPEAAFDLAEGSL